MNTQRYSLGAFRYWWSEDRPVYLNLRPSWWRWGWKGDGWNGLLLGPITVWFKSGPSPVARLRKAVSRG